MTWTAEELAILKGLRLPDRWDIEDPSNAYLHDPSAAQWGEKLFFDKRLSRSRQIACATCHQPDHYFTASPNSGINLDKQVPTLLGVASLQWYMLDGRVDSLWSQALKPLEHPLEHHGTRTDYVQLIARYYPHAYAATFGPLPSAITQDDLPAQASPVSALAHEQQHWQQLDKDTQTAINHVFANIGKALAAYQATLWPRPSRFDRFVTQLLTANASSGLPTTHVFTGSASTADTFTDNTFSPDEIAGLKLFISEQGQCLHCHNGPLLTNGGFHVTTVPSPHPMAKAGRLNGIETAYADPFNCLGPYSDSAPEQCKALRFSKRNTPELRGATKVPTLRNIAETAPYMHAGQFTTLHDVLQYYNRAATPFAAHTDLSPLKLLPYQLNQLEAFLRTLSRDHRHPPTDIYANSSHFESDHSQSNHAASLYPASSYTAYAMQYASENPQ
ncbi:methylamine utilization protein [Photobacterium japonica]|uniref:cytochrome-c peroxidase n=1 Tax=Photobacterium japonica TaxID=2910235 RepID=UPI003D138B4D